MNKKDLLRLKDSFDNKRMYTQYIGNEGPLYEQLTERQILEMLDSDKAVAVSMEIMKQMINYLSNRDISYTGIALCPSFSIFVDSDFITDEGKITNEKAVLQDYVGIAFDKGYVYSGQKSKIFPIDILEEGQCVVYSRFSDFVVGLNECDFRLDGISDFNDICSIVCCNNTPFGKIELTFQKKRPYTKRKK